MKLRLSCPGLLTAVHRKYFHVLNHRELLFNDFGDRVAQLLHVESAMPYLQNRSSSCVQQQSLIVNTHLVFPHDHSLSVVQLKQVCANDYPVSQYFSRLCSNWLLWEWQVYKILQYIQAYQEEHKLSPMPIILCGWVTRLISTFLYEYHSEMDTNIWLGHSYYSDWNGSKRGQVYKFLCSQGFVSSYDTAHQYSDSEEDAHKVTG
jgi:hypothetical protein